MEDRSVNMRHKAQNRRLCEGSSMETSEQLTQLNVDVVLRAASGREDERTRSELGRKS